MYNKKRKRDIKNNKLVFILGDNKKDKKEKEIKKFKSNETNQSKENLKKMMKIWKKIENQEEANIGEFLEMEINGKY